MRVLQLAFQSAGVRMMATQYDAIVTSDADRRYCRKCIYAAPPLEMHSYTCDYFDLTHKVRGCKGGRGCIKRVIGDRIRVPGMEAIHDAQWKASERRKKCAASGATDAAREPEINYNEVGVMFEF